MSPRRQQLTLEPESAPVSRETSVAAQTLVQLALERVDPSPLNPRKHFDPVALDDLTASMQADGQVQPIVVRPIGAGADLRYSIVAGERRYRAAQRLQWRTIHAIVRPELNEQTHARISLLANLARSDLNPVEEARGYKQLLDLGMTQEEVAKAVNRSRPAIANALRLLEAPEPVLTKLEEIGPDGKPKLSPGHVLPLLKYKAFPQVLIRVAEIAAERRTPSKELEGGLGDLGYTFTQALSSEKLMVSTYSAEFDTAVCKQCPFGAYVSGGYCIKPEHFRQLQKEARTTKEAEVQQAVEAASADGTTVLQLRSLKYGQYERLEYGMPKGCTTKCECRAVAMDGMRQVKICTKPARLRQLKDDERKAQDAARKAMMEDLAQRCGAVLDQADTVRARELAIVATYLCSSINAKPFNAIIAKHAPGVKTKQADFGDFEALQPLALVKIALEALLAKDIETLQWRDQAQYAQHYAGPAPKPDKPSRRGKPQPKRDEADPEAAMTAIGAELHELVTGAVK